MFGAISLENDYLSTNISLKAGDEFLQNKYQTCDIISKFILRFVGFSFETIKLPLFSDC